MRLITVNMVNTQPLSTVANAAPVAISFQRSLSVSVSKALVMLFPSTLFSTGGASRKRRTNRVLATLMAKSFCSAFVSSRTSCSGLTIQAPPTCSMSICRFAAATNGIGTLRPVAAGTFFKAGTTTSVRRFGRRSAAIDTQSCVLALIVSAGLIRLGFGHWVTSKHHCSTLNAHCQQPNLTAEPAA